MPFRPLICSIAALFTATALAENTPITVQIDLATQRFIGQESALDRGKFLNVHSDYSANSAFNQADAKLLVEHYDVGFGRFFNSPFNYYRGGPPYPTRQALEALAPERRWMKLSNPNAQYHTTKRIVTEHPKKVFRLNDDFEEAARFAADYFELMYSDANRPAFYEPMNEPFVHAGEFGDDQKQVRLKMSQFFAAIGKEFDRRGVETQVLGYSSAWPSMELWDFRHWNTRMKLFMDVAGEHVDGISFHPYDGTNVTGQDNRRSGSNVEAIMDLIETYGFIKWGQPKPLAITEFGDIPKGFDRAYSPASSSAHLNSLNHLTFGFLDRQDRILIAIPFITTKSPWFYNDPNNNFEPYGVDLWRPDKSSTKNGAVTEFLPTEKFLYFDLWKDVRGDRVVAHADDPDLYTHAFTHGSTTYLCLNNLESDSRLVRITHQAALPEGTTTRLRRLYVPQGEGAVYTDEERDHAVTEFKLRPHEAAVIEYRLPSPITRTQKAVTRTHYSETYLQPIEAGKPIVFEFDGVPTGEGRAYLRMSLGRKHDVSKQPATVINGVSLTVPDDWPGYDQKNRSDFFGAITIPVPTEALRSETSVTLTFPDTGGRVSSLVLVTELREPVRR
ncbi:MAG: T9SS C-terminal target domain-containing protein [Planctomycetota bacterium]